jgi:polar amino acid transport system substrate-binding protein
MRRLLPVALLATGALAVAACAPESPSEGTGASTGSSNENACSPSDLATLEPETLTIATDEPAYEPWVVGDAPESGEGFEAAVAYAVAEELGYS